MHAMWPKIIGVVYISLYLLTY